MTLVLDVRIHFKIHHTSNCFIETSSGCPQVRNICQICIFHERIEEIKGKDMHAYETALIVVVF